MPLPAQLQPPRHHEISFGVTTLQRIGFSTTLGMMGVTVMVSVKVGRGESGLKRKKAHPESAEVLRVKLQDRSSPQIWFLMDANSRIKVTPTLALYFLTRNSNNSQGNAVTGTEIPK
jgi:hypothetical protein